ncbi:hypothetical protein TUMSATVNIG1_58050 (plasmid) [Vibrio nigripulchritudo]|nr:hypothetical protein VNTUMSATTG_57560 [Vibrio nigripulchritudo]BDU35196.1 hypothetical protein TUMSATVNIG1_58050 [Vibrio nigripulchritudo]
MELQTDTSTLLQTEAEQTPPWKEAIRVKRVRFFMCARRFKIFNDIDDFNREALIIEIDLNLPTQRAFCVLERIVVWQGYPNQLRMDNGSEFYRYDFS